MDEANSLFHVDQMFLRKILARKSFVRKSTESLDFDNTVSVPFDWEMSPGTPKDGESEFVPPVKPPPALQSSNLDIPKFAPTETTTHCFGIKSWKIRPHLSSNNKLAKSKSHQRDIQGDDAPELIEFFDYVNSVTYGDHGHSRSSSSSSSSFNSSSNSSGSSSSRLRSFAKGLIKWSFL